MKKSTNLFLEELKVNIPGEFDGVAITAIHDSLGRCATQHWSTMITMVGLKRCEFGDVV
jgi:hypothetical protein